MATAYRIRNWDKYFENSRTRQMNTMRWVPIPNDMDGDGYTELMAEPDGLLVYGCWILVTLVASKCHPRGTLLRKTGIPHDAGSLSRISRAPEKNFTKALPKLVQIGWIEECQVPDTDVLPFCQAPDTEGRKEGRKEGKRGVSRPAAELPCLPRHLKDLTEPWAKFIKHRSEIRKPLKQTQCAGIFKNLETMGVPRAIAALEHTIANGWQGIREPDHPMDTRTGRPMSPHAPKPAFQRKTKPTNPLEIDKENTINAQYDQARARRIKRVEEIGEEAVRAEETAKREAKA